MKASIRNSALAALVLFVQCAALGWLIWRYERIVRFGTEVRFRCTAYDPYDPLRGRYLRTTVREQCSSFIECSAEDFSSEARGDFGYREPNLYAKLEPSTNGLWCVAAVAEAPQSDGGLWVKPRWSRVEHSIGWSDKRKDESYDAFEKRRDASPLVATVGLPDQLFERAHRSRGREGPAKGDIRQRRGRCRGLSRDGRRDRHHRHRDQRQVCCRACQGGFA